MGFESFRVELRPRHATFAEAKEAVRRLPHARPDRAAFVSGGSAYYTVEDGTHVIEVEVASPVRVSCRFTLCHPPSIDAAFLGLIRELSRRLGATEIAGEDMVKEHAGVESPEFASTLSARIAARRAEWDAGFGTVRYPATTAEAFARYVLPKCVPVAGPAARGSLTAAPPAPAVPAPSP